jgi:16S rRNA (guanine527-N7)-methyltransferase
MGGAMDGLRPALRSIVEALGLDMTGARFDLLLDYLALLQRWNSTYNLTAVRDPAAMLTQHLADCLAVFGPLQRKLAHRGINSEKVRMLDVGSGGGLPGVVIAALMPAADVTCVDTVGKKAAFIQQAAAELRLPNLHSVHARVEQLKLAPFEVVTSRAFASLPDFTRLTAPLLAPNGVWMAMKGKTPSEEIASLPLDIEVFHVEHLAVPDLNAERCIVWMQAKTNEKRSL